MSKKIFRFKSDVYGVKGEFLPRNLDFLRDFPFAQVIEEQQNEKIEVRVEIKVQHLKKLIKNYEHLKNENNRIITESTQQKSMLALYGEIISADDLQKLREALITCKKERIRLENDLEVAQHSAEKMNNELSRIQQQIIRAYELSEEGSKFRTIFNREIQPNWRWPPLQGGAPGLKR